MSSLSEDFELLFFETFAPDGHEGPNLGLVQFPNPIIIKEIRVIPLGARVEADFGGGLRLGATNPNAFELEFFINDLTRGDACTFADIGSLEYKQNVNIKFVPKEMIPTDGLILRGMYTCLTLSVFGCIADITSIIAQDPVQSSTSISEPIKSEQISNEFIDETQTDKIDSISDDIVSDKSNELKSIQVSQPLSESSDDLSKKKFSPSVHRRNESRASSLSSDRSDRKRKDKNNETISRSSRSRNRRQHSNERSRRSRSPLSSITTKNRSRSRSKSKSKSRSTTPYSLKRYHYNRRSPSSPLDRSPKRYNRSPRRHNSRSISPRSPYYTNKALSKSPLSPLTTLTHNRSRSKSPLLSVNRRRSKSNDNNINKPEIKVTDSNLAFDDSDLFEPLSPDRMSLSDIAEKISDDENLDQILNEVDEESESRSKCDVFDAISSEEEYDDDGNVDNDLLMDYSDYELGVYADFCTFNPFQCEFTSLQTLKDNSLSIYETPENEMLVSAQNETKIYEMTKSFRNEQRNELWVETIEQLSQEITKVFIKDESIIEILTDFVVDGLNFDLAMNQSKTAFKVRHLKAGIKLLISLSQTNEKIMKRLLEHNLMKLLLELYNKPFMTIPVRLLIIRGMDAICDSPSGVNHLISHKYKWDSEIKEQTCYQRLLEIFVENPSTRIIVSLTSLMKKIHLFEVLKFLSKVNEKSNDESVNEESIAVCLSEIALCYKNANNLINQPFRYLPATKQFELKASPYDSYKCIYKYFRYYNIIECITNILSAQLTCSTDAFDSILDLLNSMSNFQHGLKFLLSFDIINSTNNLQKILIQQCDESESQLQNVGLKLIYRLQVLQLVDMLFTLNSVQERSKTPTINENFDDPDSVATLQHLYSILFTGVGRDAIVHILSAEHNFDAILPFISLTGDKKKDIKLSKSVSCGCAVELCLVTIQLIDNNLMSFFDNYGQTLLKLSENELIPKLQTISNWLTPIKSGSYNVYNENTFKYLMIIIKKHYDSIRESADNALFTISPELITTLRILQNLCIPSEYQSMESDVQLKYKYAIIQIYSSEGLSQLLFILNKLCDTYLKPSHQSVALIGNQGSLVVNFVKPSILIIKSILTYLVSVRANDFKDISPIAILLRIYSVMAFVPTSMLNISIAQLIQFEITEILLLYTELYIIVPESEDAISKSVWTKMTKMIIDYTLSSPLAFLHGLTIFSDVLPQLLPLLVKQPMLNEEVIKTINFRKLWSAHLHPLSEDIDKMIKSLINSNFQAVQLLLKRICSQLCDMSAPTVNVVVKSIVEAFIESLESFNFQTNSSGNIKICSTVRILNFILDFCANTPFKLGLLGFIVTQLKREGKSGPILTRLHSVITKSSLSSSQDVINNILKPIPDLDTSASDGNVNPSEAPKVETITSESIISNTESLNNYFVNRQVFVLTTHIEDERLGPDWISAPNEDSEQFDVSDSLKIDFLEMSQKYLGPEYDIRVNMEKLWREPIEPDLKEIDILEKTKSLPFIRAGPKEPIVLNKRIQAPRGRGRAFTRLNDPFRSRPPNTSRPPSMHVDDFVALERNDSGPKRVNKEFMRPNRGMNTSMRSFNTTIRSVYHSSNTNTYGNFHRTSPSNTRNVIDRYNSRDLHSLSSNRINKSSDSNIQPQLRWNRMNGNRYDFRNPQYSRSFPR